MARQLMAAIESSEIQPSSISAPGIPQIGPFSSLGAYNATTTRKPLISQFSKNAHSISPVILVPYGKVKIM